MKATLAIMAVALIFPLIGCTKTESTKLDAAAHVFLEGKLADPHLLKIEWKKEGRNWEGTIKATAKWSERNPYSSVGFPLSIELNKNLVITGYM